MGVSIALWHAPSTVHLGLVALDDVVKGIARREEVRVGYHLLRSPDILLLWLLGILALLMLLLVVLLVMLLVLLLVLLLLVLLLLLLLLLLVRRQLIGGVVAIHGDGIWQDSVAGP